MNILLVNYEYPPLGGGAGNATLFIGKALAAIGHEPTVLTAAAEGLPAQSVADGVRVLRIPVLRKARDRSNALEMSSFVGSSLFSARRIVKRHGIEGVVTFFTIPSGPVGWHLSRSLGLPYIVSLRGGDVPGLVAEISGIHRIIGPVRRAVLRRARAVVANSKSLAQLSERTDPVPVRVIPNGVDTDFFRPAPSARTEEPFGVLFVGRLRAEHKNVSLLFNEVARLRAAGILPETSIEIVGDGPDRPNLEQLAARLGIASSVRWRGWLTKPEVAEAYRRASCFVNPSFYEGMPNTVLEAMASGVPVVVSDVGGNNEVVDHGRTGLIFDLTLPGDLGECIARLAREPQLARTLGERGRRAVIERHSWTRVAEEYADLLGAGARAESN